MPNKGTRIPGVAGEQPWFKKKRKQSRRKNKLQKAARKRQRD